MKKKVFFLFVLLLLLLFFCYLDVLQNPQIYYDDAASLFSYPIASSRFSWQTLKNVLLFSYAGFRPVPYLSFYLNYLFSSGGQSLNGYIYVNFVLHFFNAVLIYFSLKKIVKDTKIAIIVSFLWALSPVNVFPVVYIVQRMTEFMFFFGFVSFLFFVNYLETRKAFFFILSLVFLALSILSKENGLLFIPFFFVYAVWFGYLKIEKRMVYLSFILLFIVFYIANSFVFVSKYKFMGITPFQRLLTQSRVLLFYLKNMIVPVKSNIFLYLEFDKSLSLFNPLSTFFAVLVIVALFFLSYFLYEKEKIISFSIISFFIFHSLESTVYPLYTAFFHRNYVPSVFVYIVLVIVMKRVLKKELLFYLTLGVVIVNFIFVLKVHNASWVSPFYYESQNYKNFPLHKDLAGNLGRRYVLRGDLDKAISLYLNSFSSENFPTRLQKLMTVFYNKGDYNSVVNLGRLTDFTDAKVLVGKAYKMQGKFKLAEECFKNVLKKGFSAQAFFAYLDLLAKQGRFRDILNLIDKYENKAGNNYLITLYRVNSLIELGEFEKASKLIPDLKEENLRLWMMGKLMLYQEKYQKAIEILKRIDIKNLTAANIFIEMHKTLLLSKAYKAIGERGKAIQVIEDFRKKTPAFSKVMDKELKKLKGEN